MTVFLGDRDRFAAEVGEWTSRGLCRVDLWAAGQWLTCDDNTAYVPQFRHSVARDTDWLRKGNGEPFPFPGLTAAAAYRRLDANDDDGELRWRFRYLDWGPTVDNISALLFRDGDRLTLAWDFWREEHLRTHPEHIGEVFVVELAAAELIGVLDGVVAALDEGVEPK